MLGAYVLDRCCDFRGIVEMGKFVRPWAMLLHVPLDVLSQVTESLPFVIARAFVREIAADPLKRMSTRTVRREPEQLKTAVACQPLLDGFGFLHTVGSHDDREARHCWRWIGVIPKRQEGTNQPIIVASPKTREHLARRQLKRPGEIWPSCPL